MALYICLSVRLSVSNALTEGHRKQFDLEPSYAISLAIEHLKLKEGVSVGASNGTDYRQKQRTIGGSRNCTKIGQYWTLTYCELQLAKRLDSRVDIG